MAMRSMELALDRYDTDKIGLGYLKRYDQVLQPWLDKKVVLLEIGVRRGGSLLLWRDYFPLGKIIGIDIKLPSEASPGERIQLFEGSQGDVSFLSRVANEVAPDGFDIIIDDASHIGELTKIGFWHLFDNHLKPGGLFVVEDWGTGYWDDWPDGKHLNLDPYLTHVGPRFMRTPFWFRIAIKLGLKVPLRGHSYGMVGFIKQLIDEQGAHDATRLRWSGKPQRQSRFESLLITSSLVFVRKAASSS